MRVNELCILDIQPSQFYVSEEKVKLINEWFDPNNLSNFDPIPIKLLNGKYIFTDGHTRAFVAHNAGLINIPFVLDESDLDWEAYQICVNACIKRGVYTVNGFCDRILQKKEYAKLWIGWCEVLHEVLELQAK